MSFSLSNRNDLSGEPGQLYIREGEREATILFDRNLTLDQLAYQLRNAADTIDQFRLDPLRGVPTVRFARGSR